MTNKRRKPRNEFDYNHFIKLTKRRFKKKFGKPITTQEINKIWKDFVKHGIIEKVADGDKVKIDKHSTIQLVGRLIEDDKQFMSLLKNGLMVENGRVMKAELKGRRRDVKYKIVYENTLAKTKIYFKAALGFRKYIRETLNNTNNYFYIYQ